MTALTMGVTATQAGAAAGVGAGGGGVGLRVVMIADVGVEGEAVDGVVALRILHLTTQTRVLMMVNKKRLCL